MNVGVFGGTFDPPHTGHLIVAQDAALALRLDRVLFVPAATPPHKLGRRMTPAATRARMLELAIAGDPTFSWSRLELDRTGPSFTVDTLAALFESQPDNHWTLLLGADQYTEFDTWREPDRIRELARVAVMAREGETGGMGPEERGDVRVPVTRVDISATEIRRRVASGEPIRYLVPAAVESFIFEQRLYTETAVV